MAWISAQFWSRYGPAHYLFPIPGSDKFSSLCEHFLKTIIFSAWDQASAFCLHVILLSLSFPKFWFLNSFGHYILKRCASDGPMDLAVASFLLNFFQLFFFFFFFFFFYTLQESQIYMPRITFRKKI